MFNRDELLAIATALAAAIKSAMRLAAKDEQPENVAAEYRKTIGTLTMLRNKVVSESDKLVVKK